MYAGANTEEPGQLQDRDMIERSAAHLDERTIDAGKLIKAENAREISIPYPGDEYTCPNCEAMIPTRKQRTLSKPAKYSHMLNDVMKCPFCSFVFSYRMRAVVLQE